MRRWAAVGGLVLLVAACTGGDHGGSSKPHPLKGTATTLQDYSDVALPRVSGSTTTTIREVGTATIDGTVSGPGGLLPGATVRIERLVGDQVRRSDVTTGADGRFVLPNVPGGRYRVRAFLPPALAQTTPELRFLDDGKEATFSLTVEDQRKVVARAAVSPATPYLGDDVNLAVVVANRIVDQNGVVQSIPLPGLQVELSGLGAYAMKGPDQPRPGKGTTTTTFFSFDQGTVGFTDANGQVRYALECVQPGDPGLSLLVTVTVTPAAQPGQPPPQPTQQLQHLPLDVPPCIDFSATTTTTAKSGSTRTTDTTADDRDTGD